MSPLSSQEPPGLLWAIGRPDLSPRGLSAGWRMLNAKTLFHQNLSTGGAKPALGQARSTSRGFLLEAAAQEYSARAQDLQRSLTPSMPPSVGQVFALSACSTLALPGRMDGCGFSPPTFAFRLAP